MPTIASLREDIDQLHNELHALLLRRRDLTMKVWRIKQTEGVAFYDANRETEILHKFISQGLPQDRDPQTDQLLSGVMESILREYEIYLLAKFS